MGNSKVAELDIKSILVIFYYHSTPQEAEQRTVQTGPKSHPGGDHEGFISLEYQLEVLLIILHLIIFFMLIVLAKQKLPNL